MSDTTDTDNGSVVIHQVDIHQADTPQLAYIVEEAIQEHDISVNIDNTAEELNKLIRELNQTTYYYSKLYWRNIYIDRAFYTAIVISSLLAGVVALVDIIHPINVAIETIYLILGLITINFASIVTKLVLQIRHKCIKYNLIHAMYKQITYDYKKKLTTDMMHDEFHNMYNEIINKINLIECKHIVI